MHIKLTFKLLIFAPILVLIQNINAQENNFEKIQIQDHLFRANLSFQGVYLSYEKKIDDFVSLYSDIGLGSVFGHSSQFGDRWAISPIAAIEGRWYFNYKKRQASGLKVLFNAADFLSIQGGYISKPIDKQSFADIKSEYFLFSNIGMQRTWKSYINLELKLGFGIVYSDEYKSGTFAYNLNLKFGYIFNRVKQ